jgi:uncharacterized protein (TIGR02594 family)
MPRVWFGFCPDWVICFHEKGTKLMRLERKRLTALLLCSVALAVLTGSAFARPLHKPAFRHRAAQAASQPQNSDVGGFSSNSLVAEARKYIGTNPTGRGSLWCGAFMDLVLKRTGRPGGGNLASGYAHYGTRVAEPQVGAIAVMGRRGGGHVGVVTGIDANGNPIIVSGNTWNRSTGGRHNVAESVYPRGRISTYVMPGN